jgi:putative redox protein
MGVRVKWDEGKTFVGTASTGHKIVFGNSGADGQRPGPSAMELLLMGTGGCSAYDVISILEKGRQKIDDVEIEIEADRADDHPKVFTRIHMHFIVKGRDLNPKRVEQALSLSIDKYCSASAMMAMSAKLTHDYEIIETCA